MWKVKRSPLAQLHKQQKHLQISKAFEYATRVGKPWMTVETLDDCGPPTLHLAECAHMWFLDFPVMIDLSECHFTYEISYHLPLISVSSGGTL